MLLTQFERKSSFDKRRAGHSSNGLPGTKFNVFRANYARSCRRDRHEAAFMFIQTVSVVERNFISARKRGRRDDYKVKARSRKRRTGWVRASRHPPRRVSDDTRRGEGGGREEGNERSFGIRGA